MFWRGGGGGEMILNQIIHPCVNLDTASYGFKKK